MIGPIDCLKRGATLTCIIALVVLNSLVSAHADVSIDIRSAGVISPDDPVGYVVFIGDCADVTSVGIVAGDTNLKVPSSDMMHVPGSGSAYEYSFSAQAGTILRSQSRSVTAPAKPMLKPFRWKRPPRF